MLSLTVEQRLALKGRAHALNPTVMIGNAGLTDAVLKEIAASLKAHELIKVKVMAERDQREAIMTEICERLDAAPVQHIGKTLVIYLPKPEAELAGIRKVPSRKGKKPLTKRQLGERS